MGDCRGVLLCLDGECIVGDFCIGWVGSMCFDEGWCFFIGKFFGWDLCGFCWVYEGDNGILWWCLEGESCVGKNECL